MKLVEENYNFLRYKFNHVFGFLITAFVCAILTCSSAYLCSEEILECKYNNLNERQCKITTIAPFIPGQSPEIVLISNPQKVELITNVSKVTSYNIKIISSSRYITFSAGYYDKNFVIGIQEKIEKYLKEYRGNPLVATVDSKDFFYYITILSLSILVRQFCSPIITDCNVNKKDNLILIKNNYLGLVINEKKYLLTEVKLIGKENYYSKGCFVIYFETKVGKKIKFRSPLTKKQAQQLINKINYFLYSFYI